MGQLELFGRRARKNEHPLALEELRAIVLHLIDREYIDVIDESLPFEKKVILLATEFRSRLTTLVTNWIRVGFCQGNFNSDNCAAGGFTLDYGPFGFMDMFDPKYQPWTGGGEHFSYFNQPRAAERNFQMFCKAIKPLIKSQEFALSQLDEIENSFSIMMQEKMEKMWASKLGLGTFEASLFKELIMLMMETHVDYSIFFRELSSIPEDMTPLLKSFYRESLVDEKILSSWSQWLEKWKLQLNATTPMSRENLSTQMRGVNPKYILREWFLVPAYQQASKGDYKLISELQEVMTNPYAELSDEMEEKYYRKKASHFFEVAGISHVSCSS